MIKRFLSIWATAAFVISACSADDPVAPTSDISADSSSSVQSIPSSSSDIVPSSDSKTISSSESKTISSSGIVKNDTTFFIENAAFTENDCFVTSNAAEKKVELYMTYAGTALNITKITFTADDKVNLESTLLYDASVSDARVKQYCEETKEYALAEEGTTVVCDRRSVTALKTTSSNGQTFNEISESLQEQCNSFKKLFNITDSTTLLKVESSSSIQIILPESSSSALPDSLKTEKSRATCEITKDTDEAFNMVITAPDSITKTIEATYNNNIFSINAVAVFAPNVPQSVIDKECAREKAEVAADGDGTVVICSGNVITESLSFMVTENMLILAAPSLVGMCDKVQETGIIPEDDDF